MCGFPGLGFGDCVVFLGKGLGTFWFSLVRFGAGLVIGSCHSQF